MTVRFSMYIFSSKMLYNKHVLLLWLYFLKKNIKEKNHCKTEFHKDDCWTATKENLWKSRPSFSRT